MFGIGDEPTYTPDIAKKVIEKRLAEVEKAIKSSEDAINENQEYINWHKKNLLVANQTKKDLLEALRLIGG